MRTLILISEHPNYPDPRARRVSGTHEPGMIFQVNGGYVAINSDNLAFEGLFPTEAEARDAIAEARDTIYSSINRS